SSCAALYSTPSGYDAVLLESDRRKNGSAPGATTSRVPSEINLRTIFDATPDAAMVIRVSGPGVARLRGDRVADGTVEPNREVFGHLVDVNLGFETTFGWSREEVIDRTFQELDLWVDDAARVELLRRLMENRRVENFEAELRGKNGGVSTFSLSGTLVLVAN